MVENDPASATPVESKIRKFRQVADWIKKVVSDDSDLLPTKTLADLISLDNKRDRPSITGTPMEMNFTTQEFSEAYAAIEKLYGPNGDTEFAAICSEVGVYSRNSVDCTISLIPSRDEDKRLQLTMRVVPAFPEDMSDEDKFNLQAEACHSRIEALTPFHRRTSAPSININCFKGVPRDKRYWS